MAPAERVRTAVAPSTVMLFSSLRLPLMLKPPLPRSREPVVVEVAADDAGLQADDADRVAAGERELLDVFGLDRLAESDIGLQRGASAVTVTDSVSAPVSSAKSIVCALAASSWTSGGRPS